MSSDEVAINWAGALDTLKKRNALIKAGGTFNDDFIESDIEFTMQHVARFEMTPHRYFCAWRQYVAGLRYFIFDDRLYLAEKLLR